MTVKIDLDALLDQTFFGLDTLTMLGGVEDFIDFSERNIKCQKYRERQRSEQECNYPDFDDPLLEAQYRYQTLVDVKYRFEIILAQRIRYATLIALIATIEWVMLALKKRAAFKLPKKPGNKSEVVQAVSVFIEYAEITLGQKIDLLEQLCHVRNCIVHTAGLLEPYKHESELRQTLGRLSGVKPQLPRRWDRD